MRNERQNAINRLREQQAFHDKWEDDFDRTVKRGFKTFLAFWLLMLVANLVILGVAIWAIVQLVQWVQTK